MAEVGSFGRWSEPGKKLLNELEQEAYTAYIPNPHLTPDTLYEAVAEELGVEGASTIRRQDLMFCIRRELAEDEEYEEEDDVDKSSFQTV